MKTTSYEVGTGVFIDLGHKVIYGIVTEYNGNEFITVKHDNFKGEVFKVEQIIADDIGIV